MPIGKYTLLDAIKFHAPEEMQEIISEVAQLTPEVGVLPLRDIPTTTYQTLVRTANPVASFRRVGEGVPESKASFAPKVFQTFPLDHQVALDRALKDSHGETGFAQLMVEHMSGALEAALQTSCTQIYYGDPNSDKGFPGLLAQYAADAAHEVDATGTADKYSVWMINATLGHCSLISGGGRKALFEQGPWELKDLKDIAGNTYQGFASWLYGNVGFELKNKHAALRGKNLSFSQAGKGLTDEILNAMWTKTIRNGNRPTAIFMPPEAVEQLQNSRTATTETGVKAPRPTSFNNIPIYETSSIVIGAAGE